ncbi:MAG: hypothetical protein J0H80_07830, partial [Rhizobiales bacterium]|nr:hypothetical protein [Hyphomicrobiales bacterium]
RPRDRRPFGARPECRAGRPGRRPQPLRIGPDEGTDKFGYYRQSSLESMVDVFGWSKLSGELDSSFTNDLIAEINDFDRQAIVKRAETFDVSRL